MMKFTDDELDQLKLLTESQAWVVFKRLMENEKEGIKSMLISEQSVDAIRQLQGRYVGVNVLITTPELIAKARAEKERLAKLKKTKT